MNYASWDHIKNLAVSYCGARPPASWLAPIGRESELANAAFYEALDQTLYSHPWIDAYREVGDSATTYFIPKRLAETVKYRGETIEDNGAVTVYSLDRFKARFAVVSHIFAPATSYTYGTEAVYSGLVYRYIGEEDSTPSAWADRVVADWVQCSAATGTDGYDWEVPTYSAGTFYNPGELVKTTTNPGYIYVKKTNAAAGTATSGTAASSADWDCLGSHVSGDVVLENRRPFLRLLGIEAPYEYKQDGKYIRLNTALDATEEITFKCTVRLQPQDIDDPYLRDAIALNLGAKVAMPLKADMNIAAKLTGEYERIRYLARSKDSLDSGGKPSVYTHWDGEEEEFADNDQRRS